MTYDGELDIAIGLSARSKVWSNKKLKWSELVSRLGEENKTTETFKEFVSASKEDQLKIKDVGGYVGGYLRGGRRSPANVVHRQLMTLDLDFATKTSGMTLLSSLTMQLFCMGLTNTQMRLPGTD